MEQWLFLYSAYTWLAYTINEQYYGQKHYVWCTPYFASGSLPSADATNPPTSTPSEICHTLEAEVRAGDRHSAIISQNKIGIAKGATVKRAAGQITKADEEEIMDILQAAQIQDFRPLLYIIAFSSASPLLSHVPIKERAHPLSVEYIIESLPRNYFDVIELSRR
jgi:hypothetical protein